MGGDLRSDPLDPPLLWGASASLSSPAGVCCLDIVKRTMYAMLCARRNYLVNQTREIGCYFLVIFLCCSSMPVSSLEPELQNVIRERDQSIATVYFNKGL